MSVLVLGWRPAAMWVRVCTVAWNVLAYRLRTQLLDVTAPDATGLPLTTLVLSTAQYAAPWVASIFISYQKDTLMRKNYVVLRIVKKIDAKRIEALRGEKQDLEMRLERVARSEHVKFVETNARGEPKSRHGMRRWKKRRPREASNGTGTTSRNMPSVIL